jgi:predicted anti-sigma-YlaC factor YlaD
VNPEKLTCHAVARILSDGLDAELPVAERARLRVHLALCDACRNVEQQFEFLRKLMQRIEPRDPPDRGG